jgi:hypothetical protein
MVDMKYMSISKRLKAELERFEPGAIFGLKNFIELGNPQAVALELSRLSKEGTIKRLSKGKYFIPKVSRFGNLGPSEWQILDTILKENGGYFAGETALNRIGISTQVPSVISIRGARSTRTLTIGSLTVNLYKAGNSEAVFANPNVTDIVEAIRLIKKTQDGEVSKTLSRVKGIVKGLSEKDIEKLVSIIRNERPFVRATFGAILEELEKPQAAEIRGSLNPLTKFKIGLESKFLPNMENWGIS